MQMASKRCMACHATGTRAFSGDGCGTTAIIAGIMDENTITDTETDARLGVCRGDHGGASEARLIVVMGVSGTGKSTLGGALAARMRLPFIDGDDVHPAANVAKMARGEPLDDEDRWPWLERIRDKVAERVYEQLGVEPCLEEKKMARRRVGAIVACSALKMAYRAVLRGEVQGLAMSTYFVYLKGDREVLMARLLSRQGHFMKAGMLESQLDALESPEGELGVVAVPAEIPTEEQVQRIVEALDASPPIQ